MIFFHLSYFWQIPFRCCELQLNSVESVFQCTMYVRDYVASFKNSYLERLCIGCSCKNKMYFWHQDWLIFQKLNKKNQINIMDKTISVLENVFFCVCVCTSPQTFLKNFKWDECVRHFQSSLCQVILAWTSQWIKSGHMGFKRIKVILTLKPVDCPKSIIINSGSGMMFT